jgi:hypothetical protein
MISAQLRWIRKTKATFGVAFALGVGLLSSACSKPDPLDGFWGYAWGTPMADVLADSATIAFRLADDGFQLEREPNRIILKNVQYGMGYGDVRLDFSPGGGLWHGHVRIPVSSQHEVDSVRTQWEGRFGDAKEGGRIDQETAYTTLWVAGPTLDRDFFSTERMLEVGPEEISGIDLFLGGCLSGCPLYSIRLLPDGQAVLHSVRDHEPLGGFAALWDPASFAELARESASPAFRTLQSRYSPQAGGGLPTRGAQAHYADGNTVTSYTAEHSGPPVLEDLLQKLEALTAQLEWTRPLVNWDTLKLVDQRYINLDSLTVLATR